jgi:hypothetical protein
MDNSARAPFPGSIADIVQRHASRTRPVSRQREGAANTVSRDFESKLRAALKGVFSGARHHTLRLQALSEDLWRAAQEERTIDAEAEHHTALSHVSVAREIQQAARHLQNLLEDKERRVWEALKKGYLTPDGYVAYRSLANPVFSWTGPTLLADLIAHADSWAEKATDDADIRRGAKRGQRGRLTPKTLARRLFSEYITLVMAGHGVPLRSGVVTRVLAVVYHEAGIAVVNVKRDAQKVLKSEDPWFRARLNAACRTHSARPG